MSRRCSMYYLIIAVIVAMDQTIKFLVQQNMRLGESIPVIPGVFHLTYIQNTGGAFSILQGNMVVLLLVPALFLSAILVYIYKKRKEAHVLLLLALSLICGGGLGNFIDRARLGYVVDFFDIQIWPIFNIADICVCCGCGLLFLYVLFFDRQGKEKTADSHE